MPGRRSLVPMLACVVLLSAWHAQAQTIVSGLDAGSVPEVSVFNAATTARIGSFLAYPPSFAGGVRVATGDVNGDGVLDIITGAGAGASTGLGGHVKAFNGRDGAELYSFLAFGADFQGGVFVAAGDVNGDGAADIVVGADAGGGPHVKVFDGRSLQELKSFFAYDAGFRGGVRVAAGDVNGDGMADVITGTGAGALAHVKAFNGQSNELLASFIPYDPSFQGGVYVAVGDVDGDGRGDVVTGAGAGAGPHVKVFNLATTETLASFLAFDASFTGGVRVAAGDVTGDGIADIIVGAGPGGAPHIKVFRGDTLALVRSFLSASPAFAGGVYVAAGTGRRTPVTPHERLTILIAEVEVALPQATRLLENAAALLEDGPTSAVCGILGAFEHHADAQSGKHLSVAQAAHFVVSARNIQTALGCR